MSNNRRQQLYDRIRASSLDEVIVEEMVRLGFWPDDRDKPSLPEAAIKHRGELTRELRSLLARQREIADPERALKLLRKERLAASRRRRLETKRRKVETRFERSRTWHEKRKHEIVYLGDGVSNGLSDRTPDTAKLDSLGLPALDDDAALASAMGVSVAELRFLCFARQTSTVSHYQRFVIPKKTGGERLISAPMPRLKRAQYWVLDNVLERLALHDAAHGFRKGRSIVSNAAPHAGKALVVNLDLENFFPTIDYPRVLGLFRSFGYSRHTSTLLTLLCTEPDLDEVTLDGQILFVARGERRLPQGAPTSPAISNLICRRLDHRLNGMARSLGYDYTRYADDLSFSRARNGSHAVGKLLFRVRQIVADEGFIVHPDKTRVMRQGTRQEVTGLVVNDRPSVDRVRLRRFRALLNQIERDGPQGKHWEGHQEHLFDVLLGFASFVHMASPEKGTALLTRVRSLKHRFAHGEPAATGEPATSWTPGPLAPIAFRAAAAEGRAPREDWWRPLERPAPVFEMPKELLLPEERPKTRRRSSTRADQASPERGQPERERAGPAPRRPRRRYTAFWWRLFEVLVKLVVLIVAFRIHPYLGYLIAAILIIRSLIR